MSVVEHIWYGWIPILSGKLFMLDANTIWDKGEKLSSDINDVHGVKVELRDVEDNKLKISIKGQYTINTICTLEDGGLCRISIVGSDIHDDETQARESAAVAMIYRFVRDIYHEHIYHKNDQPLHLIYTSDRDFAIENIIDQYRNKIIDYHQECKNLSKNHRYDELVTVGTAGLGEIRYGIAFANIFSKTDVIPLFENAYISLKGFVEQITSETMVNVSNQVKVLTIYAIGLAVFFSLIEVLPQIPLSIEASFIVAIIVAAAVVSALRYYKFSHE